MAKYQQYEEYKDSGVEWLGEIPSHWGIQPLKHLLLLIKNGATATQVDETDKTVPISRIETISTGEINTSKVGYINPNTISESYKLDKGDILFSHINSLSMIGNLALKRDETTLFHGMNLLRLKVDASKVNEEYFFWLLKSKNLRQVFEANAKPAINQASLSTNSIKNIYLNIPDEDEQTQIANFLDYETAQIDTLIEKQQTLIQLLKEKRQAVISHAVTKGLNPDAPMKDSGVEWLGEVPEHWEVSKLKYYSSIQGGYAFSSDSFTEEGVQILKIGNVYQNRLALERQPTFVPEVMLEALPDFIVKDGDILMSLTGTLGKRDYGFAVAIKDNGKYLLNQRVAKLNPADEKIDRDFLLNVLWSESYLNQLYSLPSGTKQANLSNSDVLDIVITLPPSKTEQKEIAVELRNQKDIFDKAIQKAMTSIELMQERRTALISAAVTGKIDVRGWRASE